MITHQKLLQTVERRGHSREIIEALLDCGRRSESFADKDRLETLADTLTTDTRTVTVQRDEEIIAFCCTWTIAPADTRARIGSATTS